MSIVEINSAPNSGGIASPGSQTKNILDKDAFLNLLVTQLQFQDPLNPMESTEFTAQLAQFSSLEQLQGINNNMEMLQASQDLENTFRAVDFIGRSVKASSNTLLLTNGVSGGIQFELEADAKAVFINIYDSLGNFVRGVEKGTLNAGEHAVAWDGNDNKGHKVPDGTYTIEVLATDANDEMVNTKTFTTGKVTGVTFNNGNPYLLVGNRMIAVGDVIRITEAEE